MRAIVLIAMLSTADAVLGQAHGFEVVEQPPLPVEVDHPFFGVHNGAAVVVQGQNAWVLPNRAVVAQDSPWRRHMALTIPRLGGAATSAPRGVLCIGGLHEGEPSAAVTLLSWNEAESMLANRELPDLPHPLVGGAATMDGSTVYVTDGRRIWTLDFSIDRPSWRTIAAPPAVTSPVMVSLQGVIYLFGRTDAGPAAWKYAEPKRRDVEANRDGVPSPAGRTWQPITAPPVWPTHADAAPYHLSYIFVFAGPDEAGASDGRILAYNTIIDRWITMPAVTGRSPTSLRAAVFGDDAFVLAGPQLLRVTPQQLQTNYHGLIDNGIIAVYLLGMVAMGWYFMRREDSTKDFFRGGQRIPWWAAGMSLFATGASAISLAAMPGMAFGTDWTYFLISIWSVVFLPIALFVLAPLVRRLNIATANEYLERRFGITSRLFGSAVYMFFQIAGRTASVMLISAIALEAITDLDLWTCIVIMGVITTVYTYLGGLEAVIWTDTVQGFVMIASVVGCLVLALLWLPIGPGEMWRTVTAYGKNDMIDLTLSLTGPTAWVLMINVLFTVLQGVTDQNFVQRVQSTPDLRQTKLAVATQLAVAVPINILLFSLGTVLWLFYRAHPERLSPTIVNNDGVFPFFAAQQLPIGVSGLVVAALLAATMSTVSSSICSVSDLGTNDFYRRFKRHATDRQCLWLGRILTAVVGGFGTLCAIVLAGLEDVKSVWDLFIMVTGLIASGVLGLFLLGLLSRRAHESGALIGAIVGMGSVFYTKAQTDVSPFLYIGIGAVVTIIVGFVLSLVLPGRPRQLTGLTVHTLRQASAASGALHVPASGVKEAANESTP